LLERTLVLIKPDAMDRGLAGAIISRIEQKGLRIAGLKMLRFTPELARRHYAEHVNKDWYPYLEEFIMSGNCIALAAEGNDAVAMMRMIMGATRHTAAQPGSIRGDYACTTRRNLVHGSDSPESAARELALFFKEEELFKIEWLDPPTPMDD
jgi:nucleoside-diphosphate kinase